MDCLACWQAISAKILSQELDSRGQVWIEFEDTDKARGLERTFYNGTAVVNLADYLSMQKVLKTMIFSIRRNAYGNNDYELHRRYNY